MPSNGGSAGRPAGSASPIGRMPQDRSRLPIQTDGSTVISSTQLREPLGVQRHPVPGAQHVGLFLDDVEQSVPRQVGGDAIGLVEDDPQPVQRLVDLDAIPQHVLIEPVLVDRVGQVHRGLRVAAQAESAASAAGNQDERVLDPEVGVVPDAGDEEDVPGPVVCVEVGPVVEVAVRRPRPSDRLRNLVNGKLIHWAKHHALPSDPRVASLLPAGSSIRRFSSDA
jgi:hypothetical protein